MLKRLAAATLLLPGFSMLWGATYYISPTGSDSNPGSLSQPWATYSNAVNVVAAGDTVLVQPGVYHATNNVNSQNYGGVCYFTTAGTASLPIIFRANGPVTNLFMFWVAGQYYSFDGFTWDGADHIVSDCVVLDYGSDFTTVTNCTFQNTLDCYGVNIWANTHTNGAPPEVYPSHCAILNCTFNHMAANAGVACVGLTGIGHLVQGCTFANGLSMDSIYPFGSNSVMRLNTFTNMHEAPGYGNHPDILQAFGDHGSWSVDMLFERNHVIRCPVQLCEFTMDLTPDTNKWGIVFKNNVFEDSNMQASIDISNVKFYNNTFRNCTAGGGAILAFAFYDPNWIGYFRGYAYGAEVKNNAFVNCNGGYGFGAAGPYQGDLTNGVGTAKGRANLWLSGDTTAQLCYLYGTYSNLSGTITSATVYCDAGDCYTFDATNFVGGVFNLRFTFDATRVDALTQWGYFNNNLMRVRLNTTTITNGEVSGCMFAYTVNTASLYANCDYNYQGAVGEVHGLQSGNVNLLATNAWPATMAQPLVGSVLIDAGTNLTLLGVTNDFQGSTRPYGPGFDIGAFEYNGSTLPPVPATILTAPQSIITIPGTNVGFSVVPGVAMAPISYQWQFNGTDISGATSTSYTLSNVQVSNSGFYSIRALNAAGSDSRIAHLSVGYFTNGPVLWFNFDQNFTGGHVVDVSGKGNDGWQMDATNWVAATTGVGTNTAAQFYYNGVMSNDPPNVYRKGQYIAVTNLDGFAYLTNGTISLWAQFDANSDTDMKLLDTGYNASYDQLATNSWSLGLSGAASPYLWMTFYVYPASGGEVPVLYWKTQEFDPVTQSTPNFHLYTATIDCLGNQAIAYYDGRPVATNSIDLPFIKVYGCPAQSWLCIGAMSHDGTPQWGDDEYPNSGFFCGKMDDIRIYNRTLAASEVQSLYSGSQILIRPPTPSGIHFVRVGP